MKVRSSVWTAAMAGMLLPGGLSAQTAIDRADLQAPDVLIYGEPLRKSAVELSQDPQAAPASVTAISKAELDRKTVTTYGDIFRSTPGMWVTEYNQGGIAYGLSMRGFTDGEHGRDIAIFLDGMPLNVNASQHTNGYVDLAQIIPELISRVDITRGPFSPFVGNNAVGGSIQLYTDANPSPSLKASIDSFGRTRAVPILAADAGPGRLLVAAEASNGLGYTDNSRVQRLNLFTRYVFPVADGLLAVRVQAYDGDADAPGYLNRDAIRSGALSEKTALSPTLGDTKSQQNLVLNFQSDDVEGKVSGGWSATLYANNDQRKRWTGGSTLQLPSNPVTIRGEDDRLVQIGGDVRKVTSFDSFGLPSQFAAGVSFNSEDLQGTRAVTDEARNPVARFRDRHIVTQSAAGYGQYQVKPVERLKLTFGLRYDHFSYDISSGAADSSAPSQNINTDISIASPKFGAAFEVYRGVEHHAELYGNVARGFKTPWPWDDFFSNPARSASPLLSYEIGLKGRTNDNGVFWRAGIWQTRQKREVFTDPASGITTDFGETRRRGIDVEAEYQLSESTRLLGNYSWIDAKSLSATQGFDSITNVPDYIASLGVQSVHSIGQHRWDFSLFDLLVGSKPLDPSNTLKSGSYQRIVGRVSYGNANWGRATVFLTLIAYPGDKRNLNESAFDFGGFVAASAQAPWRAVAGVSIPF